MKYLVGISGIIFFSFVAITSLVRGCQAIKRLRTPLTVEGARHAKKPK